MQKHQDTPNQQRADQSPPLPAIAAASDLQVMDRQVEIITHEVVDSVIHVINVAKDMEQLVIQNANRVKNELREHIELATLVNAEAAKLGGVIETIRNAQAEVAMRRKGNGQH
jgi:hypothetical protein